MFRRKRKKKISKQYTNLIFIEVKKHMGIIEDDINYLRFILDGSDGMYIPLRYKMVGVKEYGKDKILVTIADTDIFKVKEYLERYDGVDVV